jgi:hypothetical protein
MAELSPKRDVCSSPTTKHPTAEYAIHEEDSPISHGFCHTMKSMDATKSSSFSQGMDILADITSNASPIQILQDNNGDIISETITNPMENHQSTLNTTSSTLWNDIAPVGQSLSIYAAIAAQAGVSTCCSSSPTASFVTLQSIGAEAPENSLPPTTEDSKTTHQNMVDDPIGIQTLNPDIFSPKLSRPIGKIRRFCDKKGSFGEWIDLPRPIIGDSPPRRWNHLNIDESVEIPLSKGGRLRVFPYFLTDTRREELVQAMSSSSSYRQSLCESGRSRRDRATHIPSFSNISNFDDDITMETSNFDVNEKGHYSATMIPEMNNFATDLADLYNLSDRKWNMGVDVRVYSSQRNEMNFDHSRGEILFLCVVIQGTHEVMFKPMGSINTLEDNQEEITLFLGEGDAFEVDGMHQSCLHCST